MNRAVCARTSSYAPVASSARVWIPRWTLAFVRSLVMAQRVEDDGRLLRRRRVVQVDEAVSVDLPFQNREVGPRSAAGSSAACPGRVSVVIGVAARPYRPAPAGSGSRGTASASSGRSVSNPFSRRIGP